MLCVTFTLYVSIVSIVWLSYCTGYLCILPIFTIVKLNVLLLLCISIYSIACASYFIHCVILCDL